MPRRFRLTPTGRARKFWERALLHVAVFATLALLAWAVEIATK